MRNARRLVFGGFLGLAIVVLPGRAQASDTDLVCRDVSTTEIKCCLVNGEDVIGCFDIKIQ